MVRVVSLGYIRTNALKGSGGGEGKNQPHAPPGRSKSYATVVEMADVFCQVFGEYVEPSIF